MQVGEENCLSSQQRCIVTVFVYLETLLIVHQGHRDIVKLKRTKAAAAARTAAEAAAAMGPRMSAHLSKEN
jgi:hypothetical protein